MIYAIIHLFVLCCSIWKPEPIRVKIEPFSGEEFCSVYFSELVGLIYTKFGEDIGHSSKLLK